MKLLLIIFLVLSSVGGAQTMNEKAEAIRAELLKKLKYDLDIPQCMVRSDGSWLCE